MPPFMPASHQARGIAELFTFVIVLSIVVFATVTGLVLFIAWRFRRREIGDEPRPVFGHRTIEIVWTAVPIGIVALLFVLTLIQMRAADPPTPSGRTPDVVLVAHQWWWEIRYPAAHVVTANDLHIPAGTPQLVELRSADVIHDFWVPRLSRKIDMTPGRPVRLWLAPDTVGTFFGACAEFCGAEHAWMRIRVTVDSAPGFRAWLAAQQAPALAPLADDARVGSSLFSALTCANCHAVAGTADTAQVGPDLTHVASRPALAAERLPNTSENLRAWLAQPDVIKPASHMPNLHLRDADLNDLVAYLETLR